MKTIIEPEVNLQRRNVFLDDIEKKSDFPATYILGVLAFCLFLVYGSYIELHLTNLVSIIFAVYWTMKDLERPEQMDREQWYTYWLIWSGFFILDLIMPNVLKKIPLFYFFKLIFFIWLFLPATNGARFLYDTIFHHIKLPFNFERINIILNKFKERINSVIDRYYKNIDIPLKSTIKEEPIEGVPQKAPEEIVRDVIGKPLEPMIEKNLTGEPIVSSFSMTQNPLNELFHEDVQHESRQNILSDAKINTEKLKTNLQNVRDQIHHTVDKLKEVREGIIPPEETRSQTFTQGQTDTINRNINPNLSEKERPYTYENIYEKKVL